MPKFITKPRLIEKILLKNGFVLMRQTGSHRIYHRKETNAKTTLPHHPGELAKGTVNSIIKQSKLERTLFLK